MEGRWSGRCARSLSEYVDRKIRGQFRYSSTRQAARERSNSTLLFPPVWQNHPCSYHAPEMGVSLRRLRPCAGGPGTWHPADQLEPNALLFLDDIHRLSPLLERSSTPRCRISARHHDRESPAAMSSSSICRLYLVARRSRSMLNNRYGIASALSRARIYYSWKN